MKLKIAITLMITLLLSGCFKEEGQIRITSDVENAIIYIDGDKKGMTGDGYTTIIIEEGEHKVRINKENKEWYYEGEQDVFVGANSSVKIKIDTDKKPTIFRLERLAREKKEREERLAREKKKREEKLTREKKEREEKRLSIVKKSGFSSYPDGTFIDVQMKLMWQDNRDTKTIKKNWQGAKDYCQDLTLGKYSDWYLPTKEQLEDLYSKKYKLKNVASNRYWSSSSLKANYLDFAWRINFINGSVLNYGSTFNPSHVRCVRGRQ